MASSVPREEAVRSKAELARDGGHEFADVRTVAREEGALEESLEPRVVSVRALSSMATKDPHLDEELRVEVERRAVEGRAVDGRVDVVLGGDSV